MLGRMVSAVAVGICLATGAIAQEDKAVELRFGLWAPPAHPLMVTGEEWAKSVTEASGGSIKITIYPAEQLGAAADHYDLARDGIADISLINPGYNPGRFPIIAHGELPFLFGDAGKGAMSLDEWYRDYAAQEMKDVKFCLAFMHPPGTIHLTKRVEKPGDLKGLSIRPANATLAQYLTSQGGTTIQASAAEMRDLLSRGTADGTVSPYGSLESWGITDVAKFHLDLPMYVANFAFVMNKASYDGLSDKQKAVIDDHCNSEWASRMPRAWVEEDEAASAALHAKSDHEFYEPTPEVRQLWVDAAAPLIERWKAAASATGINADEASARLYEIVKKNGAGL